MASFFNRRGIITILLSITSILFAALVIYEWTQSDALIFQLKEAELQRNILLRNKEENRYETEKLSAAMRNLENEQAQLVQLEKLVQAMEYEITTRGFTIPSIDSHSQYSKINLNNEIELCQTRGQLGKSQVFVAIITEFSNSKRRQTIRQTWLKNKHPQVIAKFILPDRMSESNSELREPVLLEDKLYADILFITGSSTSFSASGDRSKKMLQEVYKNYEFDYFLKIDDNGYLRQDKLINLVNKLPIKRVYWGNFVVGNRVVTDSKHKWYNPEYLSLNDRYAVHATGGGWILSRDLVQWIVMSTLPFKVWTHEDTQIGTWLSGIDIQRIPAAEHMWQLKCPTCECDSRIVILLTPLMNDTYFYDCAEADQSSFSLKPRFLSISDSNYQNQLYSGDICSSKFVTTRQRDPRLGNSRFRASKPKSNSSSNYVIFIAILFCLFICIFVTVSVVMLKICYKHIDDD
eukprot:TRINITY_DN868_c0_g1_i1.p1 TRINITY_DN868_c0_g1~~TRINITY_DN868_c0_g1_i1.p1  ORF type:complete len:463 (+),score=165.36 TRINITY_DN868_c0_g1_i1:51-1439(+)